MSRVRLAALLLVGIGLAVAACTGDDTSNPSPPASGVPPSGCATPCQSGAICYQPAENGCGGTWYCWSDTTWHCAPPDASSPGGDGGPIVFPDAGGGQDATTGADAGGSDASDAAGD
jgi:hypothetical protein